MSKLFSNLALFFNFEKLLNQKFKHCSFFFRNYLSFFSFLETKIFFGRIVEEKFKLFILNFILEMDRLK